MGTFSSTIDAFKANKKSRLIRIHRGIHYGDGLVAGTLIER